MARKPKTSADTASVPPARRRPKSEVQPTAPVPGLRTKALRRLIASVLVDESPHFAEFHSAVTGIFQGSFKKYIVVRENDQNQNSAYWSAFFSSNNLNECKSQIFSERREQFPKGMYENSALQIVSLLAGIGGGGTVECAIYRRKS